MRFLLSLKRTAALHGGFEWESNFSSLTFASGPPARAGVSPIPEDIEMDVVDLPNRSTQEILK